MSTLLIGKYQATIYPEDNGYIGAISLGFDGRGNRKRIKRRGRTKAAVTDKLRKAVDALATSIDASDSYTVGDAVRDWLARGLKDRDAHTIAANRILAERHVIPLIGAIKLKELTADQVDEWLDGLTGTLATRSLQGVHAILKRATRQAQARDKVLRNVAALVTTPKGKEGRAQQGHDPGTGYGLARARHGVAALCLRRREPAHGYPHRRGPRAGLVPRGRLGSGWRGMGAGHRSRVRS